MNDAFEQALQQIEDEKGISRGEIVGMIESSLAAAFRKDYGQKDQNVVVKFNPDEPLHENLRREDSGRRGR